MSWRDLEGRPPAAFHATMTWWGERGQMLLVGIDQMRMGLEVWGLAADGWARVRKDFVPVPENAEWWVRPLAWSTASGGVTLARLTKDGIYVQGLNDKKPRLLEARLPDDIESHTPFGAWDAPRGRAVICAPTRTRSKLFAVQGGRIEALPDGPKLDLIASTPTGLAGACVDSKRGWVSTIYELKEDGNWVEIAKRSGIMQGLAWHPREEALASFFSTGEEAMALHVLRGGSFEPRPSLTMPYVNGHGLAISPRGQVLFFGGQDFDAGGDYGNDTWATKPDGSGELAELAGRMPPLGRYNTAINLAGRMVIANHGTCSVVTQESGWTSLVPAIPRVERDAQGERFDDCLVNFAGHGDTLWMLDGEGGIWRARVGEPWSLIDVTGDDGPTGFYSKRVAMAWDPASERVILQGGQRNDGWAFSPADESWRELEGDKPKRGYGPAVTTPEGIYALLGNRLWQLKGDDWLQVGKKTLRAEYLLFDPKRIRLLTVACEGVYEIDEKGQAQRLADGSSSLDEETVVGLDPRCDSVVAYGRSSAQTLSLAELGIGSGLPQGTPAKQAQKARQEGVTGEGVGAPQSVTRRFEMLAGSSKKFWQIIVAGASHVVRFGRLGTRGQTKSKDFVDEDAAQKDAAKLIRQKTKKGYVEVASEPATEAPAAATAKAVTLGDDPADHLVHVIEKLRRLPMGDDGYEDEVYALCWESGVGFEKLEAGRDKRKKKLDNFEKKHLAIPADLRAFIERWETPTLNGNVFGVACQLRVDLGRTDLLRAGKETYTKLYDGIGLHVKGEPVNPDRTFAVADSTYSLTVALPVGPGGSTAWVAYGYDIAHPDGVLLGPLAPTFQDAFLGMALGLIDAIFIRKGRERTRLERRIEKELGDDMRPIARAWLSRYRAYAESLLDAKDTYDFDCELPEHDTEEEGLSAIVLVANEVPGAEKVAKKAKQPELAHVPFVFYGDRKEIQEALEALPDDIEYDDATLAAGGEVADHLFDYLVEHGGCPTNYSWWPQASKDEVKAALEEKGIEVEELGRGTTASLYTLAHGARAALERVTALQQRLG